MKGGKQGAAARRPGMFAGQRPLAIAGAAFALLLLVALWRSLHLTGGHLVYTLDDAYIHMAMAKNLARHGVWGVTPFGFSATSSAPLWTLLLSGTFALFGPREILPLILNLAAALLTLGAAHRILRRYLPAATPGTFLAILVALVVFTPLVPLVMSGQEHTLHLLLTLLFVDAAVRRLGARPSAEARGPGERDGIPASGGGPEPVVPGKQAGFARRLGFWLLPPLLVLVRYESLFLIAAVGVAFAWRRRVREALLLGALALAPVLGVGWSNLQHGWSFLPNPILRKANLPGADAAQLVGTFTGYVAVRRLFVNPHLFLPVLAALGLICWTLPRAQGREAHGKTVLLIFLLALGLHLSFADVGWFYRYEAYLVGLGVIGLGIAAAEWIGARDGSGEGACLGERGWMKCGRGGSRAAAVVLGLLLVVGLGDRGARAWLETPRASANIYEQQYQMGLFLKRYYEGATIALNDIGAANYLADIRCVDLYGLADREILAAFRAGTYSVATLERIGRERGARIAILYPHWVRMPASWVQVGQWQIGKNIVNGGDTVAFFALQRGEEQNLIRNLREHAARLPASIRQGGAYVEAP